MNEKVHVRWMIRRDMPEVLQIEEESNGPYRWWEEQFLRCLRQRNCIGMVAEVGDRILGYMVYELQKKKLFLLRMEQEGEGFKVFDDLIAKLQSKLSEHRRDTLEIIVSDRDLERQLYLRDKGFLAMQILEGTLDYSGGEGYLFQYCMKKKRIPFRRKYQMSCGT